MSKTIEIIITPSGESRVETKGFSGSECRDASRFLESALGKTTSERLTAEFHDVHTGREAYQQRKA